MSPIKDPPVPPPPYSELDPQPPTSPDPEEGVVAQVVGYAPLAELVMESEVVEPVRSSSGLGSTVAREVGQALKRLRGQPDRQEALRERVRSVMAEDKKAYANSAEDVRSRRQSEPEPEAGPQAASAAEDVESRRRRSVRQLGPEPEAGPQAASAAEDVKSRRRRSVRQLGPDPEAGPQAMTSKARAGSRARAGATSGQCSPRRQVPAQTVSAAVNVSERRARSRRQLLQTLGMGPESKEEVK